jgi:hypothetical protein
MDARPVKVYGEASFLFPLLVAQTFAKRFHADIAGEEAAATPDTATVMAE